MTAERYLLQPIGHVRSPLKCLRDCPKQGSEGAPEADLEIDPPYREALKGLATGQEILLFTWLHRAGRQELQVHPRGDPAHPLRGVFATRSPHRPNPIGLHRVEILKMDQGGRLTVRPLESLDGTPILDLKPVLPGGGGGP